MFIKDFIKKHAIKLIIIWGFFVLFLIVVSGYYVFTQPEKIFFIPDKQLDYTKEYQTKQDYSLEQVVILSRHNVRSPLVSKGSILDKISTRKWFNWSANAGELSLKGGQLETAMGQFFKKYLEYCGFIPENWIPKEEQVRFYANSFQRTIATAHFFATGMLPLSNTNIEHHFNVGQSDKLFIPLIQDTNEAFEKQVRTELDSLCEGKGINGLHKNLKESYHSLEQFIDFKHSEYAKIQNTKHIPIDDVFISLELGKEPQIFGNICLANTAEDALKLHIYEDGNTKSVFGYLFDFNKIKQLSEISDTYLQIQNGTYTLACNQVHPMLQEIKKEFYTDGRLFTFLCGHDSTITAVLTALEVTPYILPNSISVKTPIGGKVVFEKYHDKNGQSFAKIWYCYNTLEQLKHSPILTLDNPPAKYELELKNLTKNADGFYNYDEIISRFDKAINYYYTFFSK